MKKKRKTKKWPFVILILLILVIFGILHFFGGYFEKNKHEEETPIEIVKDEKEFSVTLAGNVLVNSNMWTGTISSDGFDFSPIFEKANDIMKKSDLNFYFQQSIVGGKELGASLYYNYNSPVEVLKTLSNLGFNAASLASIHSFDKGVDGITNSIKNMKDNNISYSGISDDENTSKNAIIEKNGAKIALLSYTMKTDENLTDDYLVNIYSDELVKNDIDSIKNKVDFIIVSIDWNGINQVEVTEEQKRIANYLSNLGVNVLVGNTGYAIQTIEKVDDMLVCYSLGNLLSGHTLIDSRISAMVDFSVKLVDKKVSIDNINISLYYNNSNGNNYKIIPFAELSNELANYMTYFDKYKSIIESGNVDLKFYNIGE